LLCRRLGAAKAKRLRGAINGGGSYFLADRNVMVAAEFRMPWAAEQAVRFVYHACRGTFPKTPSSEDGFFSRVLETSLGFFGSKILCPSRKLFPESEIYEPRPRAAGNIRILGHALGSDLYSAYVRGQVSKRWLRGLFFKDLSKPGIARVVYERAAEKVSAARSEAMRMVS
jgi:hypothetical protein